MERLFSSIEPFVEGARIITISDDTVKPVWSSVHYTVSEARSKSRRSRLSLLYNNILLAVDSFKISKRNNIGCVVSTGPGVSILLSMYLKFFKKTTIIYVETWSRFYSQSISGRIMYKVADHFYYQNKELSDFYPKGKYSGRL